MRKLFSISARILSWLLSVSLLLACGRTEPDIPSPGPTPPDPTKDTKAPEITLKIQEQNVIAGVQVDIKADQLIFDQTVAATWSDDISKSCKVDVGFIDAGGTAKAISSGDKLSEAGKLQIKVSDEAGNDSSAEIKLTRVDSWAPTITLHITEKNVVAGVKVKVDGNQLFFDSTPAASWTDDYSESLTVDVSYIPENSTAGMAIESWETILDPGKIQITVLDDAQNKSTAEIKLTSVAVIGLESLAEKELSVDVPTNLLEGLTIADGLTLQKVEVVQDGARIAVEKPHAYTPDYPGRVDLVLTLARADESTFEIEVNGLFVKCLDYHTLGVINIKPEEILPIIRQVQVGDDKAYDHIDHLRIAEATRIRDMMWEYGTGKYSAEEYQNLMMRLHTGMTLEIPKWYENYEIIWWQLADENPGIHAASEWSILNTLLNHANLCVDDPPSRVSTWCDALLDSIDKNPNGIYIFGCSAGVRSQNKRVYEAAYYWDGLFDLIEQKRFVIFVAGTNVSNPSSWVINKIVNDEYEIDDHWIYWFSSLANSDKNTHPDRHVMVTIATNKTGDIDQTWVIHESTRFPIGFADNVLFSGRGFPQYREGIIYWPSGRYTTSDTNYFNVALTSLCFQLFAEVADVDQLLEMIRSTALTDYIRFDLNGDGDTNDTYEGHPETVPLQLINPAGFFKKYLMPDNLPKSIGAGETISLNKGYYKGVIFDIPGVEVLIDGQWIAYDAKNKDLILSQNPMNLEWRLSGDLLRKMGYSSGKTVQGQIITVDDQWNGLRLEVPFEIQIK